MASIKGVQAYVAKAYARQLKVANEVENAIQSLAMSMGGTLLQIKMHHQQVVHILELIKILKNESEDLGSMRRLLGDLKSSLRLREKGSGGC